MYHLRYILILFIVGYSSVTYGQLADFNFNVTAIDETCTKNGILVMTVSNTSPNAEINYKLYLAPNFNTPFAETLENSFSSLGAGSYRVVASQILNGDSNSKQIDIVIENLVETLEFQLTDSSGINCDSTATLTVVILSGNATLYEIISGPEIRPLQTSNTFTNLVSGTYIVRVFDDCNDASSKSYTLLLANSNINIGSAIVLNTNLSCTSVEIRNSITPSINAPILYPLLINYTVFAPDGTVSEILTQNIVAGPSDVLQLIQNINLFGSQIFSVSIKITDNCNKVFL